MIYYLVFATSIGLASMANSVNKHNYKACYYFLSGTLLVLFAALRFENVGTDVRVYVKTYHLVALNSNNIFDFLKNINIEPLYGFVTFCITKIFKDFQMILLINEFLIVFFTYKTIWYYREKININIAVAVFCFCFFPESLNLQRQYIAMAILFFATTKITERKYYTFFAYLLLACGFHYSAAIGITLLFIEKLKTKKMSIFVKITFIGICYLLTRFYDTIFTFLVKNISFLPDRYISNIYLYREYNISSCMLMLYSFCFFILIISYNKNIEYNYWFVILIISLTCVFIGAKARFVQRILFYFLYYIILFLSNKELFNYICDKNQYYKKFVWHGAIYFVIICFFSLSYIYLGNSGVYPYRFFFT